MGMLNGISVSSDYVITTPGFVKEATESLGWTMFRHMQYHKDKLAQIDPENGQKDTYEELLSRCIRTAIRLKAENVTSEDIVSLCTNNHLDSVVPFISAQFIGSKVASIDPSFSIEEMRHLLDQVRPRIVFSNEQSVEKLEQLQAELHFQIVVFGRSNKHKEFQEFVSIQEDNSFKPVKVDNLKETAVIYFSSGTTGLPKGICISHYALLTQIYNSLHTENPDLEHMQSQAKRVSFPLITLSYTSLYWISAGTMLLTSVLAGFCRLVPHQFNPRTMWHLLEEYKPLTLMITPIQAMEMLDYGRPEHLGNHTLSVIVMGSPISKEYMEKLIGAFPEADVIRGYGQTEVCGPLTMFRGNDKFHRPLLKTRIESVGLPVRGITYKVVDPETNETLGPNRRGELRVKCRLVMNGYYNKDCSDAFDEEGWLKTGDIVYYDEDFCFYVVDRIKESFKYKGWFIAPASLEKELLKHPSVKQAVVVGIPKEDGCHPMGLVVLNNGRMMVGVEEEIEKFVEERVPERQRLRAGVKIIESIPMTITGKIKRRMLRDMVLDGRL